MSLTPIMAVEKVKSALKSGYTNEDLKFVFTECIESHPSILLRRISQEYLYSITAKYCISKCETQCLNIIVKCFFKDRELSKELLNFKQFILNRLINKAAISASFFLNLSNSEVQQVLRAISKLEISLGSWCLHGLSYKQFVWYCYDNHVNVNGDDKFNSAVQNAFKTLDFGPQCLTGNNDVPNYESDSVVGDLNTEISVRSISKLYETAPYKNMELVDWKVLLNSSDYKIRCAAAEAIGRYVACGYSQDQTVRALIELKSQVPREIWLRSIGSAYINLAKSSLLPPARFKGDLTTDKTGNAVLPLTQRLEPQPSTQKTFNKVSSESNGVFSYMVSFQAQGLFAISLIDCLRDVPSRALLAVHQVKIICNELEISAWQLFQPHWPCLIPRITKNYDSKFIEFFADAVLESSKQTFFEGTLPITVPLLCLQGGNQLRGCDEIAKLKLYDNSRLYTDLAAPILAMMLMNTKSDRVDQAMFIVEEKWKSLDRKFRSHKFETFLKSNSVELIFEILMLTTHENEGFAYELIKYATAAIAATGTTSGAAPGVVAGAEAESGVPISQQTVFKLIFHFSGTMRNFTGKKSMMTRIAALRGLKFLVSTILSSNLVECVLRQLTAFLQAALDVPTLANLTLQTWLAVINKVSDKKLETIIDLTYSIINEKIDSWDKDTVTCARKIAIQIKQRQRNDVKVFEGIHPQSAFEDEDVDVSEGSQSYETAYFCTDILQSLVDRDVENMYLAKQTARDFCTFCLHYQREILEWTKSDGDEYKLLGKTVSKLLLLCAKGDDELKETSVRALGLLGALDSRKTVIKSHNIPFVLVSNFQDTQETVQFFSILIEEKFLPIFEAAIHPSVQRFSAFAIQELLKLMKVNSDQALRRVFFSAELVSALSPLLKTRYSIKREHWSPPEYPIYRKDQSYSDWLLLFGMDLMNKISSPESALQSYTCFIKVLNKKHGMDVLEFLVPYAALSAVIDKNEGKTNLEAFLSEVLLILEKSGENLQQFHELIFAIIDYFRRWVNARRERKQPTYDVNLVLDKIPSQLVAQRALECGAFSRAILYFEQHVRECPGSEYETMQSLRHMYAILQDSDSLEGISAKIPTLSVEQQVQEYTATSQWDAALACYNALPATEETVTAILECLHRSGRDKEVLAELANDQPSPVLAPLGAESSWTVRDWSSLARWSSAIHSEVTNNFRQVPAMAIQGVSKCLLALRDHDMDMFVGSLSTARSSIASTLSDVITTHAVTSLRQIRELTVYLHGLADLESIGQLMFPAEDDEKFTLTENITTEVGNKLDGRLVVLSISESSEFEARRFLLSLRGAALSCIADVLPGVSNLVAQTHVDISSAARKHKQPTIALTEIATAKQLNHRDANSEHAKLLWSLGDHRAAIKMMQSQIPVRFFETPSAYKDYAELALEWTNWREIDSQADSNVLIEQYKSVIDAAPKWSEAQYHLAKYFVKLYDSTSAESRADGTLARNIVHHFGKSLELNTPHHSEALPKMITTWLDLGLPASQPNHSDIRAKRLREANTDIATWGKSVEARQIYAAIPQLLSRHNHPDKTVKNLLEQLIARVVKAHPFHALWPLIEKGPTGDKIINEAIESTRGSAKSNLTRIVNSSKIFGAKLTKICLVKAEVHKTKLKELGEDFDPCFKEPLLAVPVQRVMDRLDNIRIFGIQERIQVIHSLQRPKRITVFGDDGQEYPLLIKGHDDVRKDARLIEFTSAMNELLKSDASSASRNLRVLTYRVTPLSNKAGIIEWVDGAKPARGIIVELSKNQKLGLGSTALQNMTNTGLTLSDRVKAFKKLEGMVPPCLYKWFVNTFTDPESWLTARTRYARSLAVMSMVGYVLGLGDRHLENILLIRKSGEVLHVDFDCIFEKGASLKVPERVPFRLTQNFRDALGIVNGYEGAFRKVCEMTLSVVQENEDLLMVILESFVHDPVVQDRIQPKEAMTRARARIRGVHKPNSAPLGISGLVDELIKTATAPTNLAPMFRGWMPWV